MRSSIIGSEVKTMIYSMFGMKASKRTKQLTQAGMALGMLGGMQGATSLEGGVKGMAIGGFGGAITGGALGVTLDAMDSLAGSTKKKKGGLF